MIKLLQALALLLMLCQACHLKFSDIDLLLQELTFAAMVMFDSCSLLAPCCKRCVYCCGSKIRFMQLPPGPDLRSRNLQRRGQLGIPALCAALAVPAAAAAVAARDHL